MVRDYIKDLENAVRRFDEAICRANLSKNSEDFAFFRDSAIQRFEFTVEVLWKTIKNFLRSKHGIECYSPKSCIRELLATGVINEKETEGLLEMVDDRNLTSHTYLEEVSDAIYGKLEGYLDLIKKLYDRIT